MSRGARARETQVDPHYWQKMSKVRTCVGHRRNAGTSTPEGPAGQPVGARRHTSAERGHPHVSPMHALLAPEVQCNLTRNVKKGTEPPIRGRPDLICHIGLEIRRPTCALCWQIMKCSYATRVLSTAALLVLAILSSENAIQSLIILHCFFEQISQLLHQSHLGSLPVQNGSPSRLPRSD